MTEPASPDQPQPPNAPEPPDLDVAEPEARRESPPGDEDVREDAGTVEPPD